MKISNNLLVNHVHFQKIRSHILIHGISPRTFCVCVVARLIFRCIYDYISDYLSGVSEGEVSLFNGSPATLVNYTQRWRQWESRRFRPSLSVVLPTQLGIKTLNMAHRFLNLLLDNNPSHLSEIMLGCSFSEQ